MTSYPRYVAPADLASKAPQDWTKAEAQRFYDWLLSEMPRRIEYFSSYLDLPTDLSRGALLQIAGERTAKKLWTEPFSSAKEDGERELTEAGKSLAADMGLLLAEQIVAEAGGKVRWEILRRPKREVSYNLPVLLGFGKLNLEPIRGSIAIGWGILRGNRDSDEWKRAFGFWLAKVEE